MNRILKMSRTKKILFGLLFSFLIFYVSAIIYNIGHLRGSEARYYHYSRGAHEEQIDKKMACEIYVSRLEMRIKELTQ